MPAVLCSVKIYYCLSLTGCGSAHLYSKFSGRLRQEYCKIESSLGNLATSQFSVTASCDPPWLLPACQLLLSGAPSSSSLSLTATDAADPPACLIIFSLLLCCVACLPGNTQPWLETPLEPGLQVTLLALERICHSLYFKDLLISECYSHLVSAPCSAPYYKKTLRAYILAGLRKEKGGPDATS